MTCNCQQSNPMCVETMEFRNSMEFWMWESIRLPLPNTLVESRPHPQHRFHDSRLACSLLLLSPASRLDCFFVFIDYESAMSLPQKLGAPIQLLFEGEGHVVTVELKNGDTYRGILQEAEETMNCQLKDVTLTAKEGRVQRLENVFLRGGTIKFIVMPDILKNAPIFKKVNQMRSSKVRDDGASARKVGSKSKRA
eukprot:GSChrysophyteH2.ASY1.ANO1.1713.1 assembled CDS